MRTRAPRYVSNYDSATAMLRAIARCLHGKDFPALGLPFMQYIVPLANLLPRRPRQLLYALGGGSEAMPKKLLGQVRAERISQWVTELYPRRRYPAVAIGSSNGALVHLCAALGMPWLPQTIFIPVWQFGIHPDDMQHSMEAAIEPARKLLRANPELQLHHMYDPSDDRLNLYVMTYFRVKRLRLGETYERFLRETLPPGGTLFLVECQRTWPTTHVDERHVFQAGAVGGTTPDEFLYGSERVAHFLKQHGSPRQRWDPPQPDVERPEAEWGFEPALRDDVAQIARAQGYRLVRIIFQEPHDLSALIADLYRWWYRQHGLPTNRLLAESFILLEPWWTLHKGLVPFWMVFNQEPSARSLERYLDGSEPFDSINMMLFSNGLESIGQVPINGWRALLDRAQQHGRFIGVDEQKYPSDFASLARYHTDLKTVPRSYPPPAPLTLAQLKAFLDEQGDQYPVQWVE